jgi:ATP-binding cassette subfamily F protein 3
MSREAPHLMILDEPTNHLDIDSREALVAALNAYEGAVVLISHDPHMIELCADRLWLVGDGRVSAFDGDLDAYRRLLLERAREARREGRADKTTDSSDRKADRRAAAETRARLAPLRKAAQAAERRVEELHREQAEMARRLADPTLYQGPPTRLAELGQAEAALARKVAAAEAAWLEAHEALDAAESEGLS